MTCYSPQDCTGSQISYGKKYVHNNINLYTL